MKAFIALLTVFCCIMCFVCGRVSVGKRDVSVKPDTVTVEKTDTIIRCVPVPEKVFIERVTVDTLYSVDTVRTAVYVPLRKYIFSDTLYRAEITGYRVTVDKMEIYSRHKEKVITYPPAERKPKRFGIGITAGYGYCGGSFSPYIGVGLSYNIITF